MLGIDSGFFLQIPDRSKSRILHLAKVVGLQDNVYTAQLEEGELNAAVGQYVLILYEDGNEFLKQSAYIQQISGDQQTRVVELTTTGGPTAAESRQYYRVSAVMADLTAQVGAERDCPLLDISCTGFSISSGEDYEVGSVVDAVLGYEGEEYTGKVCVRNIRPQDDGRTRYGLHCIEDEETPGSMPEGLHHMCVSLQREQLRLASTL